MNRPESSEYAEYYANYISKFRGLMSWAFWNPSDYRCCSCLQGEASGTEASGMRPEMDGKGSSRHITDTERIFAYRALRFARADQTLLPGFEQDDYVRSGAFGERTLAGLAEELEPCAARVSAVSFVQGRCLAAPRLGQSEGSDRARAGFYHRGHQMHHRIILEERYFRPFRSA